MFHAESGFESAYTKRRRSGGYVETFVHVLSDSEASETYGYLVWVILAKSLLHAEGMRFLATAGAVHREAARR